MAEEQLEAPPPYSSKLSALQLPSVPFTSPGASEREVSSRRASDGTLTAPFAANTTSPTPPTRLLPSLESHLQTPASPQTSRNKTALISNPLSLPSAPTHAPGTPLNAQALEQHTRGNHVAHSRATSTSMEDPDDRMAAEALCGLGKADPARIVNGYETPLKYYPMSIEHTQPGSNPQQQQEPLLSLLTSAHPWLGGTLNGSLSAYSSTKSFSPRFVQYGADLVENTVGTVGRVSGVEGSIRRYLESRDDGVRGRKATQSFDERSAQERRKVSGASSVDTLPLYDENRSPDYEEQTSSSSPGGSSRLAMRPSISRSWSKQLMISTSGLGAALNEASLRSLKFCLEILGRANKHVRDLMEALRRILNDCRQSPAEPAQGRATSEKSGDAMDVDRPSRPDNAAAAVIANRIRQLNEEIWNTFKTVVETVSKYTGGALPENASVIVRWQLMSVPQRWRRASTQSNPGQEKGGDERLEEPVSSANTMLAFAVEGLEMMDQVAGVVDSTISSAERWLDTIGRRRDGVQSADSLPSEQEPLMSEMSPSGA